MRAIRYRLYGLGVAAALAFGFLNGVSVSVEADGACAPGCCKDRVSCGGSPCANNP